MNIADHSDDAVNIAPHIHSILFENDKIRVLKVVVKPGDKAGMHWHPENINYILKPGTLRFAKLDGSTVDVELTEGQVTSSPESSHAVENIGDTEVQTLQVEMKA
jgi:oxalate decarboxylase/phosphoglucose isomerase-like protein (cupin superfamily)